MKLLQQNIKGLYIFHVFHFVAEKAIQYFCKQCFYRSRSRSRSKSLGVLLLCYGYVTLHYVICYAVHLGILFQKQVRWGELKPVVPRNEQYNFRETLVLSNTAWESEARMEVNALWERISLIQADWKTETKRVQHTVWSKNMLELLMAIIQAHL